jgi:hypothetical protein
MDVRKFEEEMALNRQAYERLRKELRRNHAGQYVALAHGRHVAVAPTFDEASSAVQSLNPPPEHFVVFETDGDPMFEIIEDPRTEFVEDDLRKGA